MKNGKGFLGDVHPHFLAWLWTLVLMLQLGLVFFVFTEPSVHGIWLAGWAVWALGAIFGIVPIVALRAKCGVPRGKSYVKTTSLVDTGIYAIVRHPQSGTAGILLNLALVLLGQHWLLAVLAVAGMALLYVDTFRADDACIEKFGQDYVRYMQRVPRVNFLTGLVRLWLPPREEGREA